MASLFKNPQPGQFKAVCRRCYWTPDLAAVMATEAATTQSRWCKKLECNVFLTQCDFETTDRKVYVEHVKDLHPDCNGPWESSSLDPRLYGTKVKTHRLPIPIPVPLWTMPRRKPLDLSGLKVCPDCGLVAEVDDRPANVLWWAEHERGCQIAQAAS